MIAPGVAHCAPLDPRFMMENSALPMLSPNLRSLMPTQTRPPYFATMWDAQTVPGREASAARRAGDLDGGHDRGGGGRARRSEVHRELLGPEGEETDSQSAWLAAGGARGRERGDRGRAHVRTTGSRQTIPSIEVWTGKVVIRVRSGFDAELLRAVVAALSEGAA
jgi:hypothetical protein